MIFKIFGGIAGLLFLISDFKFISAEKIDEVIRWGITAIISLILATNLFN